MALKNPKAQFGEDQLLADFLSYRTGGFFVDVGAADGVLGSNSYAFEKELKWKGLLIEPDPRQVPFLQKNRRWPVLQAAIQSSSAGLSTFRLHAEPTLSGFLAEGDPYDVPVYSLAEVCGANEIEHIDVLSIDTEGTEFDVWRSLAGQALVEYLIVEWNTLGQPGRLQETQEFFDRAGFNLVCVTKANVLFRHRTTRLYDTPTAQAIGGIQYYHQASDQLLEHENKAEYWRREKARLERELPQLCCVTEEQ